MPIRGRERSCSCTRSSCGQDCSWARFAFCSSPTILNREANVFGYELLFRDGIEDYFCPNDAEAASKIMLDSMGLDVPCNGGRAFVNCTGENCTGDMLLKDYVTLLPSSQAVVEILESVEPDDLVMAA